jgi:hypothetical protein
MKKIWTYISVFLTGIIGGLVAMYYMMGDQVTVKVRKIKNKKTSGDNQVIVPIEVENTKKRRKRRREKK